MWDVKEPTHYSKRVEDVVPGVVVYLHLHLYHSSRAGRVQWAHKWTDSGCHRRPQYADVRAHCKKQCKEDTYVCPLTLATLHATLQCIYSRRSVTCLLVLKDTDTLAD